MRMQQGQKRDMVPRRVQQPITKAQGITPAAYPIATQDPPHSKRVQHGRHPSAVAEQLQQVVAGPNQRPLALDLLELPQQELLEASAPLLICPIEKRKMTTRGISC